MNKKDIWTWGGKIVILLALIFVLASCSETGNNWTTDADSNWDVSISIVTDTKVKSRSRAS